MQLDSWPIRRRSPCTKEWGFLLNRWLSHRPWPYPPLTIAQASTTQKDARRYLIQDENGQPLTQFALGSQFDKARTLAKVDFQFRDIRAKAATGTGDLAHSQKLLGHKNREVTEHYAKAKIPPLRGPSPSAVIVKRPASFPLRILRPRTRRTLSASARLAFPSVAITSAVLHA